MWPQDPVGTAMPVSCRSWEKALPDARWRARLILRSGSLLRISREALRRSRSRFCVRIYFTVADTPPHTGGSVGILISFDELPFVGATSASEFRPP
jgi:hypothetical protein